MAVELMMSYRNNNNSFTSKMEENAVQEAASGLESVEKLIRLLSQTQQQQQQQNQSFNNNQEKYQSSTTPSSNKSSLDLEMDCKAAADVAVSKFKRVISLLGRTRTGHARFRRAPVGVTPPFAAATNSNSTSTVSPPVSQNQANQELETKVYYATPIQQIPPPVSYHPPPPAHHHHHHHDFLSVKSGGLERKDSSTTINFSYSSAGGNSFMSSLTGDTDSKQPSSSSAFQITNLSQVSSAGKPPLSSSSFKRKCSSETLASGKCSGSSAGRCHCSKKRKLRSKRVVRVPAISLKMADIPPDDYSWRKYGQKPIKGSPHPRGYYKCSSVRGCPARKHVERALDDPSMLIVTYEGEHNHSLSVAETSNLILESS
ncbi:DNA-binding WRKY [Corchorus capsularis]|uniref:DNA-binding WRKY n=1 Tax=Corchorus capsularis TaxID=210143 RepID=A0A1R3GEV1_COCAP|nr:DNA-binding WRKY [Corchorus capsularis]